MKAKNAKMARRLEDIPNIGKAVAEDLRLLDIHSPEALIGKNGIDLYHQLNILKKTGGIHDPCMADTLMAAVDFMNGGPPKPWWEFTKKETLS